MNKSTYNGLHLSCLNTHKLPYGHLNVCHDCNFKKGVQTICMTHTSDATGKTASDCVNLKDFQSAIIRKVPNPSYLALH